MPCRPTAPSWCWWKRAWKRRETSPWSCRRGGGAGARSVQQPRQPGCPLPLHRPRDLAPERRGGHSLRLGHGHHGHHHGGLPLPQGAEPGGGGDRPATGRGEPDPRHSSLARGLPARHLRACAGRWGAGCDTGRVPRHDAPPGAGRGDLLRRQLGWRRGRGLAGGGRDRAGGGGGDHLRSGDRYLSTGVFTPMPDGQGACYSQARSSRASNWSLSASLRL